MAIYAYVYKKAFVLSKAKLTDADSWVTVAPPYDTSDDRETEIDKKTIHDPKPCLWMSFIFWNYC